MSEVFKEIYSIFLSSFTVGTSHKLYFSIFKTTLEDELNEIGYAVMSDKHACSGTNEPLRHL